MPAAFIVPAFEFIQQWIKYKKLDIGMSNEEIANNPLVIDRISKEVDEYNIGFGKWEQIKKFELVNNTWTPETGELTPTLKPKRRIILEKHKDLYDKIYS